MSRGKSKKKRRIMWGLIYAGAFFAAFAISAAAKMTVDPLGGKYAVRWDDSVGTVHTDMPYGDGPANRFDLYLPADTARETYGLVVYLHPGGFTSGDKAGDAEMLKWLCAKGYVAAGINYTLFGEETPQANVYTQSVEIRNSIPFVVAEAERLGYPIDRMAVAGGSAGHTLAMLYAYRDADTSPVPVKMVFGAVGPSCFYKEDWDNYGLDRGTEESDMAAVVLFSAMLGEMLSVDELKDGSYLEKMKSISAVSWITPDAPPTVVAYGAHDRIQPFKASIRLKAALEENNVDFKYIEFPHSGHGLQNDNIQYARYMEEVEEYLQRYMG